MAKYETEETLWCLPYDSDSVFKPFLKVPFSTYLNNIISNQYFADYQASMAREIKDKNEWNEKSWRLIELFQFLNENFEIDKWDNYISFIEDNTLRSTMGFFRLWIDTERLYLLNFLKLDSNQFQEDRIYMCLYRVLVFFNHLFSEYLFKDFDLAFLSNFIRQCTGVFQRLELVSTNESNELIRHVIALLANVKRKEKFLVDPKVLHTLKKSAGIKVSKQGESIKEVENRLMNSVGFKKKLDEEYRLRMICKPGLIEELTNNLKTLYDPIQKIKEEEGDEFFGTPEEKKKRREQSINDKITAQKRKVLGPESTEVAVYEDLDKQGRNPYEMQNYLIYGQSVKVNIDNRVKYQKEKEAEVVSVEDYDRSKFYYDDKYIEEVERADKHAGKVTEKDLNLSSKRMKKAQELKSVQDENTRVFNLKWHQDPSSARRRTVHDSSAFTKNYDNNLLFKSPFEDQMLESRRNGLDRLKESMGVKSYTVAFYEQMGNDIHPQYISTSFGADAFVKKSPQIMDTKNFRLLNQNKFDFMRKVVGYMTAQKKIKNILLQKNVPQLFPRHLSDIRQESYNPMLVSDKVRFALGKTDIRPDIYL